MKLCWTKPMPGKTLWHGQVNRDSPVRGLDAIAHEAERGPFLRLDRVVAVWLTPPGADFAGALHGLVCAA
jgi:hypothetical protein